MRRSICLLVMMLVMTYGYSQKKELKYLIEEIEVTDTAKAMAMAEQKKVELKSGIKNDEKIVKEEVALLKYIGNHNKKKIKKEEDISMMLDIVDRCVKYEIKTQKTAIFEPVLLGKSESVKENLKNGIVDPVFLGNYESNRIIRTLLFSVPEEHEIDRMTIEELVNPLPTKKISVKKLNPNYAYRWITNIEQKDLKYNPLKDVYTNADHPDYLFKWCKYDYYKGKEILGLFDKSGNLISAQMIFVVNDARNDIVDVCCWYDYKNNAYDIKSESATLKKCVESILKGEIPLNDDYLLGSALQTNMVQSMARQSLRSGAITLAEYNKIIKNTDAEIKKWVNEKERAKKQYSEETLTKARRYVRILKDYNINLVENSYRYTREEPLVGIITFKELTIKQLFLYDKNENKIVCDFEVIKKNIW